MKIAVSSSGETMDAQVDPRFGRCQYFIIYDTDSGGMEVLANEFQNASGGAGTQAAQMVVGKGVKAVLTGNCGPNAFAVLQDAGVQVVTGAAGGTVAAAVENFEQGNLQSTTGPNVGDHAGMKAQVPSGPGAGTPGARGLGGGRGCGGGRGGGRGGGGRGCGGGGRRGNF